MVFEPGDGREGMTPSHTSECDGIPWVDGAERVFRGLELGGAWERAGSCVNTCKSTLLP